MSDSETIPTPSSEEESSPFEWTDEMEFYYNLHEMGCGGISAVDGINDMTSKQTAQKQKIINRCLAMILLATGFFEEVVKDVEGD